MAILNFVKDVIDVKAAAIQALSGQNGRDFELAIETIQNSQGKVVVTGVGKSGHIGKKTAASLASTGTPAFFLHSTKGVHGDLGMIEEDVVIMILNSGETAEVISLLPSLKKNRF
jgi:arabinose-5-phosphate isomerase